MTDLDLQPSERRPRVLLVQHGSGFDGSAVSGRLVAKSLVNTGWDVHVVFGYPGPYASQYEDLGCQTHVIEHRNWLRGGNVLRYPRRVWPEIMASRQFAQFAKSLDVDLVYVNSLVSLAAVLGARRCHRPCIWHIRELFDDVGGEMRTPSIGGKAMVRQVVGRLPDSVIAISEAVRSNVLGESSKVPVDVVPNAVPTSYFAHRIPAATCREKLNLPQGVPLVGVPGTLRPMKGHPFLIDAAAVVAEKIPSCHFAISGDGNPPYPDELRQQVARHNLTDRVHFLGTVRDMPDFYRACDIACVPSRAEPFGRTVIEAFAMGTPLVASDVGGIRETVDHDETGLLVKFGDVEQLAYHIVALLEDESLRTRLSVAARKKAETDYHEDIYQERIVSIVNRVVGASHFTKKGSGQGTAALPSAS